MSTQAKREYVALKHTEYRRCVTRAQKHELIREVASTCDFSVKYVIRRLNHPLPTRKAPSSRRKTYTHADLFWLKRIWRECDFACGKLLCALVGLVLESLQKSGEQVPKDTQERLLKMSPATIDRALRPYRVERPKKRSGSVLTTLRKEVSVKALRSSQCREPGHLGLDSVALCGGSLAGKFFWILTLTDVFSGYTLIAPVWNKTAENVAEALDKMLFALSRLNPWKSIPTTGASSSTPWFIAG